MTAILKTAIEIIADQLATIPAIDSSSMEAYAKTRTSIAAAEARVKNVLAHRLSARFGGASDAAAVSIHGIRATSTMGMVGALRNWQTAARRRLEQAGVP